MSLLDNESFTSKKQKIALRKFYDRTGKHCCFLRLVDPKGKRELEALCVRLRLPQFHLCSIKSWPASDTHRHACIQTQHCCWKKLDVAGV